MRILILATASLTCASCSAIDRPSGLISRWTQQWREVATENDRERLMGWRATFVDAIAAARKGGYSSQTAAAGPLLEPDAALGPAAILPGLYRCRVIKVGARQQGNLDYVAYPYFTCQVRSDRGLKRLSKLTGSQRYVGVIFPGDAVREVFLGTLVLGDETRALQYGQDEPRDIAGYVERIGPSRWRLVMPKPHYESQLDVMELVPAGESR